MICSTINRNPKSWLLAIVGAEHVMRWLPRGTHDWRRFITPDELFALLRGAGLDAGRPQGLRLRPARLELAPLGPRPLGQLRHGEPAASGLTAGPGAAFAFQSSAAPARAAMIEATKTAILAAAKSPGSGKA